MKRIQEDSSGFYDLNKWLYFLLLCLATFALLLIKKTFVENETMAFEILEERGQMGFFNMLSGLQYASIPVVYAYKFTITGFVLWVGCFLFGYKVTYGEAWHVAAVSESIFLVAELMKISWFMFFALEHTIYDIRAFYPLSLMNFFDRQTIDPQWIYPLKALNVFEIIYWILLINGIDYKAQKKRSTAKLIVGCSYILFFIIWLSYYLIIYK
ncbi:MAG: hypothetical protein AAF149_14600 [Bacteroidota bacterium]